MVRKTIVKVGETKEKTLREIFSKKIFGCDVTISTFKYGTIERKETVLPEAAETSKLEVDMGETSYQGEQDVQESSKEEHEEKTGKKITVGLLVFSLIEAIVFYLGTIIAKQPDDILQEIIPSLLYSLIFFILINVFSKDRFNIARKIRKQNVIFWVIGVFIGSVIYSLVKVIGVFIGSVVYNLVVHFHII